MADPSKEEVQFDPTNWNAKLCGCCDMCGFCVETTFIPCWANGYVYNFLHGNEGCNVPIGLCYAVGPIPTMIRFMARAKLGLDPMKSGPCADLITGACCPCCSTVQVARELEMRGMFKASCCYDASVFADKPHGNAPDDEAPSQMTKTPGQTPAY